MAGEPAGSSVCYGIEVVESSELDVSEAYRVIGDDPQDEVYYSTCLTKRALTGFDLLPPSGPPPPVPPAPWRVGERCLSCEVAEAAPLTGYWELAERCEMCAANFSSVGGVGGGGAGGGGGGGVGGLLVELLFTVAGTVEQFDAPAREAFKARIPTHNSTRPVHLPRPRAP